MLLVRKILLFIAVMASLAIFVLPLLFARIFSHHLAYKVGALWGHLCVFFLRVIGGVSYSVKGLENMPKKPCVICVKHQSLLDIYLMLVIFGRQSWILKKEILKIPLFGWSVWATKPIAIDRKSGKRSLEQMKTQGDEKLKSGYHIIIYPEGTRVPPMQKKGYKKGAILLARELNVPIIPVGHNTGLFWHKKKHLINTGNIEIEILPSMDIIDMPVDEAMTKLQNTIEQSSDKLIKNSIVFSSYQKNFLTE